MRAFCVHRCRMRRQDHRSGSSMLRMELLSPVLMTSPSAWSVLAARLVDKYRQPKGPGGDAGQVAGGCCGNPCVFNRHWGRIQKRRQAASDSPIVTDLEMLPPKQSCQLGVEEASAPMKGSKLWCMSKPLESVCDGRGRLCYHLTMSHDLDRSVQSNRPAGVQPLSGSPKDVDWSPG